jgi:hypothetical protein
VRDRPETGNQKPETRKVDTRAAGLGLALGLALLLACDGLFPGPDDFEPSGATFYLNQHIDVVGITGKDQGFPGTGTYPVDFHARSDNAGTESDTLPAGLIFSSTSNLTQHLVLLKPHPVTAQPAGTRNELGAFCCNEFREMPRSNDTFGIGPLTDNTGLNEIIGLVRNKDIAGALWMVQRAVWMVTDSTGLDQVYRDSLAALPAGIEHRADNKHKDAKNTK